MRRLAILGLAFWTAAAALSGAELPKVKDTPGHLESLTYENVVSFFRDTQLKATEVQKRCTVFFEGEWKNRNVYSYCLIIVEKSDEDIQLTFYLTDAQELNWLTEFIDGPFFAQAEKRQLFGLMNSGRDRRRQQVGRFRVDFHKWQPRHAQILVFSFDRPSASH
jgi:hypothetical protein